MIFLALKGFGDFVILINYLNKSNEEHTVIVRKELEQLAINLLDKKHKIIILKYVEKILPIYFLRNLNMISIFKIIIGIYEVRKIIKKEIIDNNKKNTLILDYKNKRNKLIFIGINKKYVSRGKPIYESYNEFFKNEIKITTITEKVKNYIVFPFGSHEYKNKYEEEIKSYAAMNNINYKDLTIVIHSSQSKYLNRFPTLKIIIYTEIKQLLELIEKYEAIISVDTFQLHLAVLLEKPVMMLGRVNKNFIPL